VTRKTRFVVDVFYEHYSCFQLTMRYKRETQLCNLGNRYIEHALVIELNI